MREMHVVNPARTHQLHVVGHSDHPAPRFVLIGSVGVLVESVFTAAAQFSEELLEPLPSGKFEQFQGAFDRVRIAANVTDEHLVGQGGLVVAAVQSEEIIRKLRADQGTDLEFA